MAAFMAVMLLFGTVHTYGNPLLSAAGFLVGVGGFLYLIVGGDIVPRWGVAIGAWRKRHARRIAEGRGAFR
jgi:hypothetical protein